MNLSTGQRPAVWLLAWMGVIFVGSSIPGDDIPSDMPPDYLLHFAEYAVLGALAWWWCFREVLDSRPVAAVFFAALVGAGYGLFDEFHQYFVPGRCPDLSDWAADSAGVLFGASVSMILAVAIGSRPWTRNSETN